MGITIDYHRYPNGDAPGFNVTCSAEDAAGALQQLETALAHPALGGSGETTAAPEPAKKRASKKKAAAAQQASEPEPQASEPEPQASEPEPQASQAATGEDGADFLAEGDSSEADTPEARPITIEAIRERILPLGREKGLAVLKEFKAAKLSSLKEEDYPAVMRAIEAAEQAA